MSLGLTGGPDCRLQFTYIDKDGLMLVASSLHSRSPGGANDFTIVMSADRTKPVSFCIIQLPEAVKSDVMALQHAATT